MKPEFTSWLVGALGLPFVEELESGSIRVNSVASAKLGGRIPEGLVGAITKLAEGSECEATLGPAIARARAGDPAECSADCRSRVLVVPVGDGRAAAVIVPEQSALAAGPEPGRRAELTAAMSHELANALAAISGWVGVARSGRRVDEALELIEQASGTAYGIAKKLLRRPEAASEAKTPVTDISGFVEEATRLLEPKALQSRVEIKADIASGLEVRGTRDNVWSAVWNPMLNAVEAMPRGGKLLVELTGGSETVTFSVTDNGPGIDEKNLARIFQPYFTTKARGTGIGLATVKRAVDDMGGTIQLNSSRGRGTRFRIDLPRAGGVVKDKSRKRGGADDRTSGVYYSEPIEARILLVDDDPALREMMLTALAMRGADVVAASTAEEALAAEGVFELALVDMRLGDQAGDVLLAELRSAGKVQKGLIVTGSDTLPDLAEGGRPDGVLRKPFQLEDLYERVFGLLGTKEKRERAAG
jgi:signal transduction histidine kinase/CheY-like chemotaxis protein